MRLYHSSTIRFEKTNHQICLLSDALIESHLHFITAEEI